MFAPVTDAWNSLPATAQDVLWFVILLLPPLIIGLIVTRGYRPFGLVRAMMWRYRWTNALFVTLIAISVGIGVGLIAQERGLRKGTARAAEKFDLIVAAPGSEVQMLMAAVYLQPVDVPLIDGQTYDRIATHENVSLAAPIAYGDSYLASPVIGTTPQFVTHLAGDLVEGRMFASMGEAVAGARVPLKVGDRFVPAHGVGDAAEHDAHEGHDIVVVGKMRLTGSPWDKAILVPVEGVWAVHGLASGHAPDDAGSVRPSIRNIFRARLPCSCAPTSFGRITRSARNSPPTRRWPSSPAPCWPASIPCLAMSVRS